jgi:drug/metabolite transporter (DMT)-like permease
MFTGYQGYPATVVATLVGGFQPMMTLVLARTFLGEILPSHALFAVIVLLLALGFIAYVPGQKFDSKLILITLLSGLGFATSFVLVKLLYSQVSFIDGIFWSRIGAGIAAVSLFIIPKFRRSIIGFFSQKQEKNQSGLLVVGIQLLGAIGFILYNFAIAQGSVTIVNAMQGIQFAFIFIISYFMSRRFDALKEKLTTQLLVLRIIGLMLIAYGLYLLSQYV